MLPPVGKMLRIRESFYCGFWWKPIPGKKYKGIFQHPQVVNQIIATPRAFRIINRSETLRERLVANFKKNNKVDKDSLTSFGFNVEVFRYGMAVWLPKEEKVFKAAWDLIKTWPHREVFRVRYKLQGIEVEGGEELTLFDFPALAKILTDVFKDPLEKKVAVVKIIRDKDLSECVVYHHSNGEIEFHIPYRLIDKFDKSRSAEQPGDVGLCFFITDGEEFSVREIFLGD